MNTIYCTRHPETPAVCDLGFPACPLCEECRLELEEKNGFDRTIPLKNEVPRSTFSTLKASDLPKEFDPIKESVVLAQIREEKPIKQRWDWFTKLMNRFGWHRKYTVIFVDTEKIRLANWDWFNKPIKIKYEPKEK